MPPRTRTLILAGNALHEAAWQALLMAQPALDIVGSTSELAAVAEVSRTANAATILVDRPTISAEDIRQLREAIGQGELLCLVEVEEPNQLLKLLVAGAMGGMARSASVVELTQAIVAAGRGELVLPPLMANQILVALARGRAISPATTVSLTDREHDVLHRLATGQTNKEIAQGLFLSVRTVETHLHNIYGKLDVSTRTEAAIWAVRNDVHEA